MPQSLEKNADPLPGVAGSLARDGDPVREEVTVIGAIVNWRADGKPSEEVAGRAGAGNARLSCRS
jgi:hypothetical protein